MLEGSLRGTISRTKKGEGRGVEYTTLSQTTIRFDVQPSPEGGRERERSKTHSLSIIPSLLFLTWDADRSSISKQPYVSASYPTGN